MPLGDHEPIREPRGVFGEDVAAYEAARPAYPNGLIDDVLSYAQIVDDDPVLEIGAGTGKATISFASRNLDLTCIEPDERMAAVLARVCARYPRTVVVVSSYERWHNPAQRFGLLFSAQAWHWIDPISRLNLSSSSLRPGGAIALFWNEFSMRDAALRSALTEAHARHHIAELASITLGDGELTVSDPSRDWPLRDLLADDRYVDVEARRYTAQHAFTRDRYLDLLASISAYRGLPENRRVALFAEVAQMIDELSDPFQLNTDTHLYLARRRGSINNKTA